jgi:hypothetical protein
MRYVKTSYAERGYHPRGGIAAFNRTHRTSGAAHHARRAAGRLHRWSNRRRDHPTPRARRTASGHFLRTWDHHPRAVLRRAVPRRWVRAGGGWTSRGCPLACQRPGARDQRLRRRGHDVANCRAAVRARHVGSAAPSGGQRTLRCAYRSDQRLRIEQLARTPIPSWVGLGFIVVGLYQAFATHQYPPGDFRGWPLFWPIMGLGTAVIGVMVLPWTARAAWRSRGDRD